MARIDSAESSTKASQPPQALTADAIKKMTEKLSEMMGEDISKDFGQLRNEQGELINEEGLPIIEISEPVPNDEPEQAEPSYFHDGDDYLPNLATLPEDVRERLRLEREKMLDELEAEEEAEEARQREAEEQRRQEMLEKRKEEASNQKGRNKAARELQKKMGRALLQNLAKERAEDQKQEAEQLKVDEEVQRTRKISTGPKKSVSFANIPEQEDARASMPKSPPPEPSSSQSWPKGDVAFAKLRPKASSGTVPFPGAQDNQPMKLTVVERFPAAPTPLPAPRLQQPTIMTTDGDSDDESEPEELDVDTEEDEAGPKIAEDYNESDPEGDMSLEEDEMDLDFALHQREVALEYYEKRNKIGQAALEAMKNHTHEPEEELPSAVHLPEQDKPQLSKFKATRLASSYGATTATSQDSTSLGAAIIPESAAKTIQTAIRTGKIDDEERLIGGDDDSADEYENEGLQEVLELLKKGQIYTAGPDGKEFHAVPPPSAPATAATTSSSTTDQSKKETPFQDLTPLNRPKTSKFKVSRDTAGRLNPSSEVSGAPKPSGGPAPSASTMRSTVLERPTSSTSSAQKPPATAGKLPAAPPTMNSAVLERRPAAAAAAAPNSRATAIPAAIPSNIVQSPSFPSPNVCIPPNESFDPFSMIVDSPSFPNLSNTQSTGASRADTSRPSRPPIIMSSTIQETTQRPAVQDEPSRPKKVSRFMAERGL